MSSVRSEVTPTPEMTAELTDFSATLTFVNPVIKGKDEKYPNSDYAHQRVRLRGLDKIQHETHENIPDANFVHPFSDNNNQTGMKTISYTEFDSAFGSMAHYAFGQHKPIVLRPDDIHLLVVQGIARFLQRYPEEFRKTVVSFQGKQTVKIHMESINDIDDWNQMPLGFAGIIRQLINSPEVANVLLQDYSQTTKMDRTVKAITLMGTFSAYFNYTASTMCHIPQFILEGTVEDWLNVSSIPEKIINLFHLKTSEKENGLSLLHRWLERLQPVLENMYLARTGVKNSEFWQNFYKYKSKSGGCHVSGNIIYFYPFLKRPMFRSDLEDIRLNEWIMQEQIKLGKQAQPFDHEGPRTDELTTNFTEVDFILEHEVNGKAENFEMGMKAGIIAYKENSENKLNTHVDYSIFFKKNKPMDFQLKPKSVLSNSLIEESKLKDNSSKPSGTIKTPETTTLATAHTSSSSNLFAPKPKRKIQFELALDEDKPSTPAPK